MNDVVSNVTQCSGLNYLQIELKFLNNLKYFFLD